MRKAKYSPDRLVNIVNVVLMLLIVALYVATGSAAGDDVLRALSNRTVYRGGADGVVAIECAVSWDAIAMGQILDLLEERDTRITFFVSGEWAGKHAGMLVRMADAGHEIGTMGYSPSVDGDLAMVMSDVEASTGVIRRIAGVEATQYYSGRRSGVTSLRAANALGLSHILCTADLMCASGGAEDILMRASGSLFDGSILLMQPTAAALEALPLLLDMIASNGCRPCTVSEALQKGELNG